VKDTVITRQTCLHMVVSEMPPLSLECYPKGQHLVAGEAWGTLCPTWMDKEISWISANQES
jgi:hypothetical protein